MWNSLYNTLGDEYPLSEMRVYSAGGWGAANALGETSTGFRGNCMAIVSGHQNSLAIALPTYFLYFKHLAILNQGTSRHKTMFKYIVPKMWERHI